MKFKTHHYLFALFTGMASSALTAALLVHTQPQFVTMNVKKTIDKFHHELLKSELSLEVQSKKLTNFADTMNSEIAKYSVNNNKVVLVSAAAVYGLDDITPDIEKAIVRRYGE